MLLSGRKILNTRPKHQAAELSKLFSQRGAIVSEFPTIEIRPIVERESLGQSLADLTSEDWLVFTSSNGVQQAQEIFSTLSCQRCSVAVIGEKTAQSALQAGFSVQFTASISNSRDFGTQLAEYFRTIGFKRRVFLLRGNLADSVLLDILEGGGHEVVDLEIYQICLPEFSPELVSKLAEETFDLLVFTSSQACRNLCTAFSEQVLRDFRRLPSAVIGSRTAEQVRSQGFKEVIMPENSSIEDLVIEVERYFGVKDE